MEHGVAARICGLPTPVFCFSTSSDLTLSHFLSLSVWPHRCEKPASAMASMKASQLAIARGFCNGGDQRTVRCRTLCNSLQPAVVTDTQTLNIRRSQAVFLEASVSRVYGLSNVSCLCSRLQILGRSRSYSCSWRRPRRRSTNFKNKYVIEDAEKWGV